MADRGRPDATVLTYRRRIADVSLAGVDRYASSSGSSIGRRRGSRARHALAAATAIVAAVGLLSGCARFDGPDTAPFHAVPDSAHGAELNPESPVRPEQEPPDEPPPGQSPTDTPPAGPCEDPDPSVIATCLDSTGAMVMLPDGRSALVAERTTGRIMEVPKEGDPSEFARTDVDATGDGGLTGLALSPTFGEDHLVYAYVTTAEDNRVVRIAPGDEPKPILTGIPRGAHGNAGGLVFTGADRLTVLTGDAGTPQAASDPTVLAGKLLRISDPAPDSSDPTIVASGFGTAGGLCVDGKTGTLWITDRARTMDRLQNMPLGGTTPTLAWAWTERPGVGGCAAADGTVVTALDGGKAVSALTVSAESGAASGDPIPLGKDEYGHFGDVELDAKGRIWASTINTTSGGAVPSDDRVVIIPYSGGGGSRV